MVTAKFDKDGVISNLEEIFRGAEWGITDRTGSRGMTAPVWINEEDKFCQGGDQFCQFVWGECYIGLGYSPTRYSDGNYFYRIHGTENSKREKASKSNWASSADFNDEMRH